MSLLSVADALDRIVEHAVPGPTETVDLLAADGRVLAEDVRAQRTQPPFPVSAMDGFAVRAADVPTVPVILRLIGQSAAGHGFAGKVGHGEAVRIFTGAPLPDGADAIVIQENTVHDGETVTIREGAADPAFVRPAGGDFAEGDALLAKCRRLTARDITLAAAAGHAALPVRRRPVVGLLATGDELVLPGTCAAAHQIVCSNPYGIAAIVTRFGGVPRFVGIAGDTRDALRAKVEAARSSDVLVTIGGASVGDHDLVGPVLSDMGMSLAFWKIAMRPGKPLMFGRLDGLHVLGVPGNPVSSLICARLFLVPLIHALLGLPPGRPPMVPAISSVDMPGNGPREHYMRATSSNTGDGMRRVTPVASQDSSLLGHLAKADCLIVRAPHEGPVAAGDPVTTLPLDF